MHAKTCKSYWILYNYLQQTEPTSKKMNKAVITHRWRVDVKYNMWTLPEGHRMADNEQIHYCVIKNGTRWPKVSIYVELVIMCTNNHCCFQVHLALPMESFGLHVPVLQMEICRLETSIKQLTIQRCWRSRDTTGGLPGRSHSLPRLGNTKGWSGQRNLKVLTRKSG